MATKNTENTYKGNSEAHQKSGLEELFGDVIHTYTRAQAIDDGVLVDLMQNELGDVSRQHYKFPIACTHAVFEIMQKAAQDPRLSR